MKFYICTFTDYSEPLPSRLFEDNTGDFHRKSLDGTQFIARCAYCTPGEGCLDWMIGTETPLTEEEIQVVLNGPEWAGELE